MEQKEHLDPDDLDRPDWNSLLNNYSKHDIGEAYFVGRMEQLGLEVEHWGIDKRHEDDSLIFDNKMDLRLWEPLDGQSYPPDADDGFGGYIWEETPDDDGDFGPIAVPEGPSNDSIFDTISWELRGVADVKTKASESWFGKFNVRHLAHYAEWSDHYGVPTFVYMTMVDPDAEKVGQEAFLTPIPTDWNWRLLCDHYDDDSTRLSYGDIKDVVRECSISERVHRAPDGNLVLKVDEDEQRGYGYFTEQIL